MAGKSWVGEVGDKSLESERRGWVEWRGEERRGV